MGCGDGITGSGLLFRTQKLQVGQKVDLKAASNKWEGGSGIHSPSAEGHGSSWALCLPVGGAGRLPPRGPTPSPHLVPLFFEFSPSAVGMFVYLTLLFIVVFFNYKETDCHC